MSHYAAALATEAHKGLRSLVFWISFAAFMFVPAMVSLFMVILRDPEQARNMGLLGAKAGLVAGTADWPTHISVLAQGTAVAGLILFSILFAWVFGREFTDRTVTDLLALPTPRATIVGAKFVVAGLWTLIIALAGQAVGILAGFALELPGQTPGAVQDAMVTLGGTSLLMVLLMPPVAFVASAGRGEMAAVGWAFASMVLAQVAGALGWGGWVPWTVPAVFATGGETGGELGIHSFVLVLLTAVAGVVATVLWWNRADNSL